MSAQRIRLRTSGHVQWRRFAIVALPAAAIAGLLIGLTAEGAMAASISVSGQEFLVTADQLSGSGFEQFGGQVTSDGTDGSQSSQPVIVSAISTAKLTNLCQSVSVAGVTLRLTAGGNGSAVSASNLIVDAGSVSGSQAQFHNIAIGVDAGTLTEDPGVTGSSGGFGEQADGVTITGLRQDTWLTTAGTFTLPDLSLSFGGTC
jgi:hypothetical protein